MHNRWQQPITREITILIPLAIKTKANTNEYERALKQEMFEDLEYVQSLEKEVDDPESKKIEFLNEYDILLQECASKYIMCSILYSLANIDEQTKSQCTVLFGNYQFSPIIGYKDLVQGNITIKSRKSTCFVRDLQGNDLLTGTRGSDLYTISLQETSSPTPIYFMEKASPTQAWLWHHILYHLNFETINLLSNNEIVNSLPKLKFVKDQLCPSCEISKAKRSTFKTKTVSSPKGLLHMDLCGPMWIESINGHTYNLMIVDDYP
ncbi:retrovirus-related pol polyprotein from transposon TNT 1-94 [Tanacetum coccineum]